MTSLQVQAYGSNLAHLLIEIFKILFVDKHLVLDSVCTVPEIEVSRRLKNEQRDANLIAA